MEKKTLQVYANILLFLKILLLLHPITINN